MMKKLFQTILVLIVFPVLAQPPTNFFSTYGGNADDIGFSCKQTYDGQYIVVGSSSSQGNGQTDVYLMKLDSMGQIIWDKYIGGVGNEVGTSVVQLTDSGYVLAGYTSSFGAGGYDVFLVRTDKSGTVLWQRTFGGLDWDFGSDLVIGSDGNIFVVGNTYSFGSGNIDGLFLKYSLSGDLLVHKNFGGIQNDDLRSIISTNDGFLATVGLTESVKDSLGDFYFLKLDLNGDTLFTRTYGNPGKSYLNDLVQYPSGDYILVGAETYTDLPFTQSYRGFTNSTATAFLWEGNSFTHNDNEAWISVTKSIKGTARTSTLRDFDKDAFGTQGSIFSNNWNAFYPSIVNEFGGTEDEHLYSHEGTKDGGFICVGTTRSYNSDGRDIFIVKLDSSIITYAQIVGLPKHRKETNSPKIEVTESLIQITFGLLPLPNKIEVINIEGRTVQVVEEVGEKVKIEKYTLNDALYLLKFNYLDRGILVLKILVQ